eukprot:3678457-Rhodomonas_salina.2
MCAAFANKEGEDRSAAGQHCTDHPLHQLLPLAISPCNIYPLAPTLTQGGENAQGGRRQAARGRRQEGGPTHIQAALSNEMHRLEPQGAMADVKSISI